MRLYSDFKETDTSKIFPNTEFLYKEYTVYQPLQRTGKLDMQQIEKLEASDLFTNNTSICNQSEFDALAEMNRHDREKDFEAEKKYQKYLQGKKYVDEVLSILKKHTTDEVCKDYAAFENKRTDRHGGRTNDEQT